MTSDMTCDKTYDINCGVHYKIYSIYKKKIWVLMNGRLGFQRIIIGFDCGTVDKDEKKGWKKIFLPHLVNHGVSMINGRLELKKNYGVNYKCIQFYAKKMWIDKQ